MPAENDFIPFAVGGSANVLTQAAYAALTTLTQNGFTAGIAPSIQLNKVWRQSSIMAAVIADFIVANAGQPAIDDGTTATLLSNLILAIAVVARQNPVLADTGAANAYVVANAAAFTAYPTISGLVIDVSIAHANTGASTINVDGLGTKPILGLGLQPLQGSELIAQGVASLLYVVASTVNSGNGAFIVLECTGGAQQIAPATASQHAVQFGQLGSFQGIVVLSGTMTLAASAFGMICQTPSGSSGGFTVTLPSATGNASKTITIFNSSSGNLTLTAGNFNTSYGNSTTSIILPPVTTIQLECDGVSYNGIGGAGSIGAMVRPYANSTGGPSGGVGAFLAINAANTYTLPAGGSWLYSFQAFNGTSGISMGSTSSISAGGTQIYNSSGNDAQGFALRVQ